MKKLSIFFAALVMSVGSVMAAETVATVNLTDSAKWKTSSVYATEDATFTADGIIVTLSGAGWTKAVRDIKSRLMVLHIHSCLVRKMPNYP